jgi:hypothetical protein
MSFKKENIYHFYYPIYNLRNPSNDVRLGNSTILRFDGLPVRIQERFVLFWKNYFTTYREWAKTEDEYVNRKKTSAFIHLITKARSDNEAIEDAFESARDSVSILSFLYWVYFPIHHCLYFREDFEVSGGAGDYYYIPNLWICEYQSKFNKEISRLASILTKPKSEIEKKIRNTLRMFEIQVSITNMQVRFVLLATCLEVLLSTDHKRELAEKTAFLLGKNRRICYQGVRDGYQKRSEFIHGSSSKAITEDDVNTMQGTVISVLRKLIELGDSGYTKMKRIDEYLEEIEFRE